MRPTFRKLPWLGLATIIVALAFAWCLLRQPTGSEPSDTQRRGTSPSSRAASALLRPLAHQIDARFAGRLSLTRALGTLQGQSPHEAGAVTILEAAWQQAATANTADVGAYLDLHRRLLWLGWWNRAEEAAQVLLAVVPDYPPALGLLSAACFQQGRREEGAALAQRALAGTRDLVLGVVGQAHAWAAAGAFDSARSALEQAARAEPDAPEAAFLLGCLLCERNEFEQAATWLVRARAHELDAGSGRAGYIATALALRDLLAGRRAHRVPAGFDGVEVRVERRPIWAVTARLEGRGTSVTGLLVLDSGASHTVVGQEVAAIARVSEHAAASMMGVAGLSAAVPALVERLVLGDLTIEDVPVLIDRGRKQPLGPGVLGCIGVSLLREFQMTLDLRKEVLRLDPSGTAGAKSRVDVPFELVNNLLFVRAALGKSRVRQYLFDTGADSLFLAAAVVREDLGIHPGDPRAQPLETMAIGGQLIDAFQVPMTVPLVLGGEALPVGKAAIDPSVDSRNAAARMELAGTIGLFVRARFTLDFARQRLQIEP